MQLDPRNHSLGQNDYWIVEDTCKAECPTRCQNHWKIHTVNNSRTVISAEISLKCGGII